MSVVYTKQFALITGLHTMGIEQNFHKRMCQNYSQTGQFFSPGLCQHVINLQDL